MGSVIDYGWKCPVCGKNAVVSDYYYKTGEDYQTCRYCGYYHAIHIKRDEHGNYERELTHSVKLPCDDLVLAESAIHSPRKVKADFLDIRPFPVEMTADELYKYLNDSSLETIRGVYLRQPNDSFLQISYHLTQMTNENGVFQAKDVVWEEKDSGGYGVLRINDDVGTTVYSLEKGTSVEKMLEELPEDVRASATGVSFSERGMNPTFYNTTEADWLSLTVDDV